MADWQWQLELSDEDTTKSTRLALALGAGTAVCVALAVITTERYWFVMAFMLATMLVIGRLATARLRGVHATVDGPMLMVSDSRQTTTIDLRHVDRLEVRQRNASTRNLNWAVEATGPGVVEVHQLPGLEMYLNLSEDAIAALRTGIEHYHQWYRDHGDTTARAAETATAVMSPLEPLPTRVHDDFEWRPPLTAHADRNQRRVLVFTIGFAAVIAAIGVQQSWGDTTGMILALVVLPPLILLLGLGCWYAFTPAKKFRLVIADGMLEAWRGQKRTNQIPVNGITDVKVDVSHTRNHSTNTNQSIPYVLVQSHEGSERITLPVSLGMNLTAEERVSLEHAVKRRVGLA